MLNPLCLYLSPLALFIILFYSYTKRFTYLTHLFLGLSLGLAPIGGWIGVKGSLEILPLVISSGVILWVAGFDIIYACQDLDFDRRSGLYSIPQSFGLKRGLFISFLLHMCAVIIFMGVLPLGGLGIFYGISVVMVLGLFIYEHLLVSPFDLRRVNQAFFYVNSSISLLLMCGCILDLFLEI
jgi:4-hydroxybenzoate polyprenyltransferase